MIRTIYSRIEVLEFKTEKPISTIEGIVTGGNISVSSTSRIRRSLNLAMITKPEYSNIEGMDNLISINKKVRVEIGQEELGEIQWFKQGVFILSTANVSRTTSGWTINITGKDKMVMLNGTCGGMLTATTQFDKKWIENEDGSRTALEVPIYQIIFEAVNHLGGELLENIVVNDLPEYAKKIQKYVGSGPIYFLHNNESLTMDEVEKERWEKLKYDYDTYQSGSDVGYNSVEFTYPGELILKAGDSVVTLLDKILDQLENYEYFYDLDGKFIFQQIKNYTNTATPTFTDLDNLDYFHSYSNTKYQYSLTDKKTVTSITKTPSYDKIKNEFIVWGSKKLESSNNELNICYRLAIDSKPPILLANQYFYRIVDSERHTIRYEGFYTEQPDNGWELIGKPCSEWREELYRQALAADAQGATYSVYDADLLANWRQVFDNIKWKDGWNPARYKSPSSLVYWLDFIDDQAAISKYSVNAIGRRTIVENKSDVHALFTKPVPDVIFVSSPEEAIKKGYATYGQKYFVLNERYRSFFRDSSTGVSAFDCVRNMLYQHLTYNTTIQVNCIPKYDLECNNIMYINDPEMDINGNYCINSFSIPLTYNGTMSISLSEVLTRV